MIIRGITSTILCVAILISSGCLYKPQRQQGNIIEKEQVNKIQIGDSKEQVQSYLGLPLLYNPLNRNQWIYVYQLRLSNGDFFRKHLIVYFDQQNVVSKLEKNNIDAEIPKEPQ